MLHFVLSRMTEGAQGIFLVTALLSPVFMGTSLALALLLYYERKEKSKIKDQIWTIEEDGEVIFQTYDMAKAMQYMRHYNLLVLQTHTKESTISFGFNNRKGYDFYGVYLVNKKPSKVFEKEK